MTVFDWFSARPAVTPPAIWGKLPGYADYVREGVRAHEGEAWQAWVARESLPSEQLPPSARPLPAAFVLAPGSVSFAPNRHVLGVVVTSRDRVGRDCPLLVYQQAQLRWLAPHLQSQHDNAHARERWLFQLTRCLAHHVALGSASSTLHEAVQALWQRHSDGAAPPQAPLEYLNDAQDPASELRGVRHHPWADWPGRLICRNPRSGFWQQDALGRFVCAAESLRQIQERGL